LWLHQPTRFRFEPRIVVTLAPWLIRCRFLHRLSPSTTGRFRHYQDWSPSPCGRTRRRLVHIWHHCGRGTGHRVALFTRGNRDIHLCLSSTRPRCCSFCAAHQRYRVISSISASFASRRSWQQVLPRSKFFLLGTLAALAWHHRSCHRLAAPLFRLPATFTASLRSCQTWGFESKIIGGK